MKVPCKVLEEQYGYGKFLDIYQFLTIIKLKGVIGEIQYCIYFYGKYIFEGNDIFALTITHDYLGCCCNNYYGKKVINGYKGVVKPLSFSEREDYIFRIKNQSIMFDITMMI